MNKHWDIIDAQRLVMEACLWMLQCPYPTESVPLYPYAACHWFRHCRFYQDLAVQAVASNKPSKHTLDVPSLRSFLGSFDQPTVSYERWRRLVPHHCQSGYWSFLPNLGLNITENTYLRCLPVCPTFGAAIGGLGELVSWLWLAKGVDINVTDLHGAPLLQYAIVSGSAELVRRMITMGADINFAPKGLSKLDAMLYKGSPRGTAVATATIFDRPEIVSLLLDQGADINTLSGEDGTALGCAALNGNVEIVSLLLERGADTNLVGGIYGTALGCAAWRGKVEVVSLLLERGADTNLVGGSYGTALGCAALSGNVEIVSLLLERGADINAVGGDYGTALGVSTSLGRIDLVRLLMNHGANPDLTIDLGMNARAIAEGAGHLGIIQLLNSWDGGSEPI